MQIFDQIQEFLATCQSKQTRPLIAILGPTASGKTALSLKIAGLIGGEIISADSRQIYKFMDVGTDKILPSAQQGIPHHLIDLLEPDQEFTLADFKRLAFQAIENIHRHHKIPMLVGGTGLYFNAILQNYEIPQVPPDPELRQKLTLYCEENGIEALYQMLQQHDPQAAARIHPHNIRYVIRALEINLKSHTAKTDLKGERLFEVFTIGIEWPRDLLYERINLRVDLQFERGLINEVKTLLMKGYSEKLPSMSSLGYPEIFAFLRGECTLEQAAETIKKNTRNYAKRQLTWFRHYQDIHWLDGETVDTFLKSEN